MFQELCPHERLPTMSSNSTHQSSPSLEFRSCLDMKGSSSWAYWHLSLSSHTTRWPSALEHRDLSVPIIASTWDSTRNRLISDRKRICPQPRSFRCMYSKKFDVFGRNGERFIRWAICHCLTRFRCAIFNVWWWSLGFLPCHRQSVLAQNEQCIVATLRTWDQTNFTG